MNNHASKKITACISSCQLIPVYKTSSVVNCTSKSLSDFKYKASVQRKANKIETTKRHISFICSFSCF